MKKITYDIRDGVINPEYIGIITEPRDESYRFEDFRITPRTIQEIDAHIRNDSPLEYTVFDCHDEAELSSVWYSKLDFKDLDTVYLFWGIWCDEDTDVTFSIESIAMQRLWINGKMQTLCCTKTETRRQLFTFSLSKGINSICLQQHDALKFFRTTVRITSFEYEICSGKPSLIVDNLHYQKGEIAVAHNGVEKYNGERFNMVFVPVDAVNLDIDAPMQLSIKNSDSGDVLYSQVVHLYDFVSVDTSALLLTHESLFTHAIVSIEYKDNTEIQHTLSLDLYLSKPREYMVPTEERANKLLKDDMVSLDAKNYITYYLTNIFRLEESDVRNFAAWRIFSETLDLIESGRYNEYLESPGTKKYHCLSSVDDCLIEYVLCLPKGFSRDKQNSLLIFNTISNDPNSMYFHYFERTDEFPNTIVADIHGRGMTTGSYVGDIVFREILEDILHRFPIDQNKIYSMGQSNGGFSTWVLAQKTPDIFAAINPSTGVFNPLELVNVSNLRIRYMTSNADPGYTKRYELLEQARPYLKDYKEIMYERLMHNVFEQVQFSIPVLKEVMDTQREPYPNEIYYNTYMNRYRKAYWIEIHSIMPGKLYAKTHAWIADGNIHIECENITGITVTTPPQIDSLSAYIEINKQRFDISGREKTVLVLEDNRFVLKDSDKTSAIPLYKGSGLIDVYMTPLRIVNTSPNNEHYANAANALKNPRTNTYESFVCVAYPMFDSSEQEFGNQEFLKKAAYIVFDDLTTQNNFLNEIRKSLRLKCDRSGFEYLGKRYAQDYCVMQITENPWNPEYSILHVCANCKKLLSKHFFLRHIILPSYVSGYHPMLNVSALVFDGKEYYSVQDFGIEIKKYDEK